MCDQIKVKITDLSNGKEKKAVCFVNCLNEEKPPKYWTYVPYNIPGPGSNLDDFESGFGNCDCVDDCDSRSCLCTCTYHDACLVEELFNELNSRPILECGLNCSCKVNCRNRLVQLGLSVSLCVFKTDHRGFGVCANEDLKKGAFVCEYAGEIIGKEEALKRFSSQKETDSNYIHVLREHGATLTETIIDPNIFGNVGRFINHSCAPNLTAVPARAINTIPRLCFFANCNITKNTELCYNYGGNNIHNTQTGTKKCKCGAFNCLGFLPFDKNI